MAIDSTQGWGTVTGGTYLAPVTVFTPSPNQQSQGIINLDTTNWLMVRSKNIGGTFQLASPGGAVPAVLSCGSNPNLTLGIIEGYVTAPNGTGSAATALVAAACFARPS